MTSYFWNSTLSPGTEQYLYWSCESAETPYRWNYAGICDEEIDAQAKKIPEAKTREELVNMTQNLDKMLQSGMIMWPIGIQSNAPNKRHYMGLLLKHGGHKTQISQMIRLKT